MEMDKMMAGILKKYKCCICGFYLSVPPIMLGTDSEEIYKCGRCQDIVKEKKNAYHGYGQMTVNFNRVKLFEDVARHISFPCSYSSCNKTIPWGQVQQHENNCAHKTIKCPMFNANCEDIICLNKLLAHFYIKHKNFILRINSNFTIDNSQNAVFILDENGHIYIVHILAYGKIAVFSTTAGNKSTKFDLKMSLPNNNAFSITFNDLSITIFEERLHCIRCMLGKCNTIHHVFSTTNSNRNSCAKNLIQLKSSLLKELESFRGDIRYNITIKANKSNEEIKKVEDNGNRSKKSNEALKKALTCPYCMLYFAGFIFTCSTGHTLCEDCKDNLTKCPTCQSDIPLTRCFTLEALATDAEVSCENELQGCPFKGNTEQITDHEDNCTFNKK